MLTGPPPKFHGTRDILERAASTTISSVSSSPCSAAKPFKLAALLGGHRVPSAFELVS